MQTLLAYAGAWSDMTEGLRPSIHLRSNAPQRLLRHDLPLICGVGGEFGHAPGYPDDVQQLEGPPLERRLTGFARAPWRPGPRSRAVLRRTRSSRPRSRSASSWTTPPRAG